MTENADKIDNTQPLNGPLLRTARYIQITLKYAQYQGTGTAGQKNLNIMAQVHNVLKQNYKYMQQASEAVAVYSVSVEVVVVVRQ